MFWLTVALIDTHKKPCSCPNTSSLPSSAAVHPQHSLLGLLEKQRTKDNKDVHIVNMDLGWEADSRKKLGEGGEMLRHEFH